MDIKILKKIADSVTFLLIFYCKTRVWSSLVEGDATLPLSFPIQQKKLGHNRSGIPPFTKELHG